MGTRFYTFHIISPSVRQSGIHGDHRGQRLGFVDFNLVVPLSAQFCLGELQSGQKCHSSSARLWNLRKSQQNVDSDHHGHPVEWWVKGTTLTLLSLSLHKKLPVRSKTRETRFWVWNFKVALNETYPGITWQSSFRSIAHNFKILCVCVRSDRRVRWLYIGNKVRVRRGRRFKDIERQRTGKEVAAKNISNLKTSTSGKLPKIV